MNFNSTNRKIEKTFKRIQDSFNNLGFKFNKKENLSLRTLGLKGPPTIYDSGWIESLPVFDNIVPDHDPDVFVLVRPGTPFGSSEQDVLLPIFVNYNFDLDVEVPEDFLPFLKTTIMVKPSPTVELLSSQILKVLARHQRSDIN